MDVKKATEFPDVENKLHAPSKQSVFERQKKDAEAKRLREEAETAAVYEDFVKSFDDEDGPAPGMGMGMRSHAGFGSGAGSGPGVGGGPAKRHYGGGSLATGPMGRGGGRGMSSGPGSLGPPPSTLSKKRPFESFHQAPRKDADRGLLAFDDYDEGPQATARAFRTSDDEKEAAGSERASEPVIPKPTLQLSSLPPGTSPAVIKSLIPSNLVIDSVRVVSPSGPIGAGDRKSMSAIVTLSRETPANVIDTAVSALQNRYLGYGFYLSLHRHLSSATISSGSMTTASSGTAQPFGAKPVHLETAGGPPSHGPSMHGRGFAPPTSYTPSSTTQMRQQGPLLHVPVQPPRDIKELKLIHKTIESLLIHGPEFEALLMSRPEVQKEEKWAWIWDARSTGGVWYRWRLWEILTGSETRRGQGKYLPLFEDSSAWKAPDAPLSYEYTTRLDEFVSDSEYASSDEDDSGDESGQRAAGKRGITGGLTGLAIDDGTTYLNPLERAKLAHLLARLPQSTGQLRKGDVARVTAFAISHAGQGADEIVAMIISNVEKPFAFTSANPDYRHKNPQANANSSRDRDQSTSDPSTPAVINDDDDDDNKADDAAEEAEEDTSSSKLIALYLISDILSSSSTSGVRHAWRYRQLFETALRKRQLFEHLGLLERRMKWGKLRAEKWRRSVANVLGLWEGWCVFPQEAQDEFVRAFNEPPALRAEEEERRRREEADKESRRSKWKAVEEEAAATTQPGTSRLGAGGSDRDDEEDGVIDQRDVDGAPMDEDDDVDDGDVDGVPMEEDEEEDEDEDPDEVQDGNMDGEAMVNSDDEAGDDRTNGDLHDSASTLPADATSKGDEGATTAPLAGYVTSGVPRRRPRAVDMFADSGSESE